MSKILYYLFGHKTIVNETISTFTKAGLKRIRQVAVGPKSFLNRNYDEKGCFVITSLDGIEQNVNLSQYVIN